MYHYNEMQIRDRNWQKSAATHENLVCHKQCLNVVSHKLWQRSRIRSILFQELQKEITTQQRSNITLFAHMFVCLFVCLFDCWWCIITMKWRFVTGIDKRGPPHLKTSYVTSNVKTSYLINNDKEVAFAVFCSKSYKRYYKSAEKQYNVVRLFVCLSLCLFDCWRCIITVKWRFVYQ